MPSMVIVDDHADFRMWARTVLTEDGFTIVGEAGDGRSAIDAVDRLRPDVLLLDINLPDLSGIDVAEMVYDRTAVVLISSRTREDLGGRLERSHAAGFVTKVDLTGAAVQAVLRQAAR